MTKMDFVLFYLLVNTNWYLVTCINYACISKSFVKCARSWHHINTDIIVFDSGLGVCAIRAGTSL